MRKLAIVILLAHLAVLAICRPQGDKPVVLKGFDPVLLVQGKESAGLPSLSEAYNGFTYRFANSANKQVFDSDRVKYAVQNGGRCLHMASMPGDPSLFLVFKGRIYLAGSAGCLEMVRTDPTAYITQPPSIKVAVLIFPGVETIDYAGPIEILGAAGYETFTVAANSAPLQTCWGEKLIPAYTFANCPDADILVLPGGGVPNLDSDNPTVKWVREKAAKTRYTMSVCNGAFWLAAAGMLDGKTATTTYGNIARLAKGYPKIHTVYDQRFVDSGSIITTGGLSAGMDGALHLIDKIDGSAAAKSVALVEEYDADAGFVRGNLADKYIRRAGHIAYPADAKPSNEVSVGDADHWDETWSVACRTSSEPELMAAVERCLTKAKWQEVGQTSKGDDLETKWTFLGDDGRTWMATYEFTKKAGSSNIYLGHSVLQHS